MASTNEKKGAILNSLQKYLGAPSPFAYWGEEGEMNLHVSKRDNEFRSASDIELSVLRGNFIRSDHFYLLAAACLQYATFPAICCLVKFWKRKDVKNATLEDRPQLIIPNVDSQHLNRIRNLCKKGVLTRYDFNLDPRYYRSDSEKNPIAWLDIYRANSYGVGISTTALEWKPVSYDIRTAFFPEHEVMRWAQNSVLTGSFLQLPYASDVKFMYKVTDRKKNVQLMSYVSMRNEAHPEFDCDLILESLMLRTNELVVPAKTRKEAFGKRIADLIMAMDSLEALKKRAQILVVCVEDINGLKELQIKLNELAGPKYSSKIFVTTGAILHGKHVCEPGYEDNMTSSFLEYTGAKFEPAESYYFFSSEIVN